MHNKNRVQKKMNNCIETGNKRTKNMLLVCYVTS